MLKFRKTMTLRDCLSLNYIKYDKYSKQNKDN